MNSPSGTSRLNSKTAEIEVTNKKKSSLLQYIKYLLSVRRYRNEAQVSMIHARDSYSLINSGNKLRDVGENLIAN
jgi:hypothetical protein